MAVSKEDLLRWLDTLPDHTQIGIDDGGLTLQVVDDNETWFEIGGIPEPF